MLQVANLGLIFRSYENKDTEQVVRLFNTCFEAYRTTEEWKWMYLQMPKFDPSGIFVAEDQETHELVGSLVVSETIVQIKGRKRVVGMIDDVDTLPSWRGRGIATRLMRMGIEECKRKKRSAIFLYANPYGKGARIYRGLGFRDVQPSYIHAKTGGLRLSARNTPFPMNLATPLMAAASAATSRRCKTIKSPLKSRKVNCNDNRQYESYLEALNSSLGKMPLFYPYSREQLDWLIRDAPKSVSPVARYVEKAGKIVCGANGSIYRMRFFGKTFNSWAIGDLFTSELLGSQQREGYIRSLVEDMVEEGEKRGCALYMVITSKSDVTTTESLKPCGFFRFIPTSFMCLPLEHGFTLPPENIPWYCWKQHMIGVP
jgi:ribosomal protein S18 acetylase RimI-like enzyme